MAKAHQERARTIRVAVVADSPAAAEQITSALDASGYRVHSVPLNLPNAYDRVLELRPSAVLLRTTPRCLPAADTLSHALAGSGAAVVLLTPGASSSTLTLAVEAGAMLHLIEPVTAHALAAAARLAAARAQELRRLQIQVTELRQSAKTRSVVERAKAILMRRFGLTEEEAHRRLQLESRSRNRKLIETAWHVIRADGELSKRPQGAPTDE